VYAYRRLPVQITNLKSTFREIINCQEIEKIKTGIGQIEKSISDKEQEKNDLLIELRDLKELKEEIEFRIEEVKSFKEQRKSIAEKYNLDLNTLLNVACAHL
jgi:uncharacterized protein YwgA